MNLSLVSPGDIPGKENIIPVPKDDPSKVYNTCMAMSEICKENDGIGLSAVQVGVPWKLFLIRELDGSHSYYADCEYAPIGEEKAPSLEGCLSLRDKAGNIKKYKLDRYVRIMVTGKKIEFKNKLSFSDYNQELDGLYSVVFQHEIDHQRAILISDIGVPIQLW